MDDPLYHHRSPAGRLAAEPGRFDFYQAVRVLERLAAGGGFAVGGDVAPEREAVFIRVQPGLRFPAGPVSKVVTPDDDGPPEMWVTFGGLTGPDGILPQHYTALLLARGRLRDH